MTDQPHCPQNAPYPVEVDSEKTYFWCSCGQSKTQPFCDGSHKGSTFNPVKFKPEESKKVWLCGCKKSAKQPFCDGTHKGS